MALTLHYLSGSPYAWRVRLALEYKRIPYELKPLSFDAGDFKRPEFLVLNPRHRVPVIVDDGFSLYESAAIVEYLEDRLPAEPRLFSAGLRERAV
jgi:glutathione S-transferase